MAETIQDSDEAQKKIASPPIAAGGENTVGDTFCPICGREATDPSLKRFGEYFCSEAHVAEYAREVRSKQATETTAIATVTGADATASQTTGTLEPGQAPQKKAGMGSFLKMAACCGGMLLLLPALGLVSAGGLAAVAGSALSVAAVLACPIGMYFMMRGMMKRGQHGAQGQIDSRESRPHLPGDQPPTAH
ncbi:MAG: hypothetical protein AABZ16_09160 [candidate division NC10 bacterium]